MKEPADFSQLRLLITDPIQYDYEVVRPIVLLAQPASSRSDEVGMDRSTVSSKAKRFVTQGMLGLVDKRPQRSGRRGHQYPEPVANHILYLKQLYPPIHLREIVRIIARKFGYKTNHHTVKNFLKKHPVPVQLELKIETFHDFESAYQARWTVISLYYQGWQKKSIAGILKLSETHVYRLLKAFAKDDFAALEDNRTRPANHPDNQMTMPFMDTVLAIQEAYPRAGRFRVHGILEQQTGEEVASVSSVGRAMAHNRFFRDAPSQWPPLPTPRNRDDPRLLPFLPFFRHHYWFVDIRYLVQFDGHWVYSVAIIEGYSRKFLAGLVSEYQDEVTILQLLHAAFSEYGLPQGIVSDNAGVFKAHAYKQLLLNLDIERHHIDKRQSWQNLIEPQFKIQTRLADFNFEQAENLAELREQHAAFIQLFNTTNHWAHRHRDDGCKTPVTVLGWEKGRKVSLEQLSRAFRHLQFSRQVNRYGCVSVQRFYIYAERGLAKRRVAVWIYEGRLRIEYEQAMLAQYACSVDRKHQKLTSLADPQLYRTAFSSPQLEIFELDDEQWLKFMERPPVKRRRPSRKIAEQLPLIHLELLILCLLVPF